MVPKKSAYSQILDLNDENLAFSILKNLKVEMGVKMNET